MEIISEEKITLRHWQTGDEERIAQIANNPRIAANLADIFPAPYTISDAKKWVESNNSDDSRARAIVFEDKVIGNIGMSIKGEDKKHVAKMGYWIDEKYWGKGITTKAVRMFVKQVFETYQLERIEAKVYTWNPASSRVLEKAGFKFEGILRKNTLKAGRIVDELVYSILREESL